MPYHVFRHLSAITAVRPKPNDVTCAYQAGGRGEGRGAGGREGGREGRVGQRGQKEILPEGGIDEGEALKSGREGEGGEGAGGREGGREGWGIVGRRKFYLGGQN